MVKRERALLAFAHRLCIRLECAGATSSTVKKKLKKSCVASPARGTLKP